ncbi:MAG: M3 family oligoendopeptidase [Anaerolineales bacterium]|nr:M3 family oligoendopeptidase [Anaerolineales bacterium]
MSAYKLSRWNLVSLFPAPDGPEIQAAFEQMDQQVAKFEQHREKLAADIDFEDFMDVIKDMEQLTTLAHRLYSYPSLWFTEDTQNQAALALMGKVEQFMARMQNRTLFFELWWKELDKENATRLMRDTEDYYYWLEEMRHFKPHTLSEPEEKILNIKNVTGYSALITLYDAITNRYSFKIEVEGEVKEVTRGELMSLVRRPDADLRAAAYQELYRVYGEDGPILGQMYQTVVRDWRNENIDLRSFKTPVSVRNLRNDIPDAVVDTLLQVCEQNAELFQRYFRLKARWLGLERLRRYDLYAPIAKSAAKNYDFNAGAEMVLDAFREFEPRVAELAQRVFDQGHIDSEVRKGKQGGAFCASVEPGLTPFVKVNYQGQADDVATLAHELGHAIHAMLAEDHTIFTFHSSLPLAENASTFGEMLLIDRLLAEETDDAVRRDIIFRQIDDAYATIMRQAFFALFERQAHEMVEQGATVDELAQAYMENLKTQFGEAVEIGEEFKWEWVSIPHIYHTPFYVYAYAFGQLLVLSLYQQYKAEGESFKPRYLKVLEAGGSASPMAITQQAGIDITTAEFWQGGFDVIKRMVEELEALPVS